MKMNQNNYKSALITGITGQDGAYLAQLLLNKGYKVYGCYRRTSSINFWRLEELGVRENSNLHLLENDLTDLGSCIRLIETVKPAEIYNLAAQSFVGLSFSQPITTGMITGVGAVNMLEAIRLVDPSIRFYQAGTSEMFGKVVETPQSEKTPFYPRSPYACAKLYAHWMTINYRESYNIFAANGILFNHESPLRGTEFVTRKITSGLVRVKLGMTPNIQLGNLDAKRDWGFAKDYVEGMWRIINADEPDEFVLATGRTESVRSFVEMTCKLLEIKLDWQGDGIYEEGVNTETGSVIIKINEEFYRPSEVDILLGDPRKASDKLGWKASTSLEDLCNHMVEADLSRIQSKPIF